jgi:hypothetical protein
MTIVVFQTSKKQAEVGRRSEVAGMAAASSSALLERHVGAKPGHQKSFRRSRSRRYLPEKKFRRFAKFYWSNTLLEKELFCSDNLFSCVYVARTYILRFLQQWLKNSIFYK